MSILRAQSYDRELRADFLRAALGAGAVVCAVYLLQAALGGWRPRFFPWDGLLGLALIIVCTALYRQSAPHRISLAASWLVAGVNVLAAFYSQAYGIRHPVTAVYLIGIVLAGMLVGGWFLGIWSALGAVFVLTWALVELNGDASGVLDPIRSWPELWQTVLFWWALMAIAAWLVQQFAAHLERAVQISQAQTAALARTLEALGDEPELDVFLRGVLATLAEQSGARSATLYMPAGAGRIVPRLAYAGGRVQEHAAAGQRVGVEQPADWPIWQALVQTGEPLVVQDVLQDERLRDRAGLAEQGIQALMFVPLLQEGRVLGFFRIDGAQKRGFTANELALAQALAQQATLAMQLARLAEQQEQSAVIAERNRLAREIHDTLAQGFTGILIQLEAAEDLLDEGAGGAEALQHLARARALARDSLQEARRSVRALQPHALEGRDLPAALRELVQGYSGGAAVRLQVTGAPRPLAPALAAELLRIAQEAVHNAVRHAGAEQIDVTLSYAPEAMTLVVQDDGRGFDAATVDGGFGLTSMRQRAELIGARLEIDARPGAGTRIVCYAPLSGLDG